MTLPHAHLAIFVATQRDQVPASCTRYLSVDGSVPGAAVTWDHHVTGEAINLDAMPEAFDASDADGVGTTMADTDAVASVVAVLLGGKGSIGAHDRAVLESASHHCDHLRGHPAHSEAINDLGRGLHGYVVLHLREARDVNSTSQVFSHLCLTLAERIATGVALPYDTSLEQEQRALALALEEAGRIHDAGSVAVVDLRGRGPVDPGAVYARVRAPVSVFVEDHARGGTRYTVGVNPFAQGRPASLRRVLEAIAAAEFEHGAPAVTRAPGPGSENWGGRDAVFGSPWNYGSRLTLQEVLSIVVETLRQAGGGVRG